MYHKDIQPSFTLKKIQYHLKLLTGLNNEAQLIVSERYDYNKWNHDPDSKISRGTNYTTRHGSNQSHI